MVEPIYWILFIECDKITLEQINSKGKKFDEFQRYKELKRVQGNK